MINEQQEQPQINLEKLLTVEQLNALVDVIEFCSELMLKDKVVYKRLSKVSQNAEMAKKLLSFLKSEKNFDEDGEIPDGIIVKSEHRQGFSEVVKKLHNGDYDSEEEFMEDVRDFDHISTQKLGKMCKNMIKANDRLRKIKTLSSEKSTSAVSKVLTVIEVFTDAKN